MLDCWDDFIYYNDHALNPEQIDDLISVVDENNEAFEMFRLMQVKNRISGAPQAPTVRQDKSYFMSPHFNKMEHIDWIQNAWSYGFTQYIQKYPFLWHQNNVWWDGFKHHIVGKNQGYHNWHHESEPAEFADGATKRILVLHLSLTTHENEGELEFLHFGHRIQPKAGRLLIFPAGFTHTHRGNTIRGDKEKHYITGWALGH